MHNKMLVFIVCINGDLAKVVCVDINIADQTEVIKLLIKNQTQYCLCDVLRL